MAAWWLCSMGGVVHQRPVPSLSPPKRTELWHSMAPHPPAYNFNLLTYKDSQQLYPFQVFNCWGSVVVVVVAVVWSSPLSSLATGAHPFHFFSSFCLPSVKFESCCLMMSTWRYHLPPPHHHHSSSATKSFTTSFATADIHDPPSLWQSRHQSSRKLTRKKGKPIFFFRSCLCLGHVTGASEFSHFVHSCIIMFWGSSTWRHEGLIRVLEVVLVLLMWRNVGRLIFCLEQVIG